MKLCRLKVLLSVATWMAVVLACGDNNVTGDAPVSFASDVQPLLSTYCTQCHGLEGGLDLSSFQTVMAGGLSGTPVVAGDSDASLLVKRIEGTVPPVMPSVGLPLSADQISLVRRWIDEGAKEN